MGVNLQLEGDGLLYTKETTTFQAGQIIAFLNNGEALTGQALAGGTAPQLPTPYGQSTLREILDDSGASGNPQRITAAAYYVTLHEHKEEFSGSELKNIFQRAGESTPQNLPRDLKATVKLGYINPVSGQKDTYYITEAGKRYLQSGFPQSAESKTLRKKSTKSRSAASRERMNADLMAKLKGGDKGKGLKEYVEQRSVLFESKATNRAAIIATWLLDVLEHDGVRSSDLYTVYRYLGKETGSTDAQLVNGMARDNYFANSDKGRFYLSQKGENFGRHQSINSRS